MAATADPLFDPFDPALHSDTYTVFERLRRADPVHWSRPVNAWLLTRYGDVASVLRNPMFKPTFLRDQTSDLARRAGRSLPALDRLLEATLFLDSTPGHREGRRMIAATLNMRPLGDYAPMIAEITDEMVAGLVGRPAFDAVADFADPMPVRVICRLLGIPDDLLPTLAATTEGILGVFNFLNPLRDLVRWDGQIATAFAMLGGLVRERRRMPREDGLTRMAVLAERDGLDDERLVARIMFLAMVGSDTTSAFMGNAIRLSLDAPEIRAAAADPAAMPAVVDELLRLDGTVLHAARRAVADTAVGALPIAEGTTVIPYLGAANRDPEAYPEPDRFIPGRPGPPHLAFGDGAHACLGGAFARLEGRIALGAFFTRLPQLRRTRPVDDWLPLDTFRRLAALPVAAA